MVDDIDLKLMNLLQEGIPITERPFDEMGAKLGISGEDTLARVKNLHEEDRFRRIGPSIAPRKVGYTSTLVAAKVPEEAFDETVAYINRYPHITHNYERDHYYNVWFTVIAEGQAEIDRVLNEIRDNTGAEEVVDLPATHLFKIQVQFNLEGKKDEID